MGDNLKYCVRVIVLFGVIPLAYVFTPVNVCDSLNGCATGDCGPGDYFDANEGACRPCGNHTFMDRARHGCTCCKPCSAPDSGAHQVIAGPCSPLSDTVMLCEPGYRTDAATGSCRPCSECDSVERCQGCGTWPRLDTLSRSKETLTMRASAVIVGSVAGSLVLCFTIIGILVYCKTKEKPYKYSSRTVC